MVFCEVVIHTMGYIVYYGISSHTYGILFRVFVSWLFALLCILASGEDSDEIFGGWLNLDRDD